MISLQHQIQVFNIFAVLSDIDECASIPCTNGGQCDNKVNSYVCACKAGYQGINCEIGNL